MAGGSKPGRRAVAWFFRALWFGFLMLALAACRPGDSGPYLEFIGGGFVFNYREAQAHYGFVVRVVRELPHGVLLEAVFDNPGGGEPFVLTQPAHSGRQRYTFSSPPVTGVIEGREYHVELRIIGPADKKAIARYRKSFRSNIDQSLLPAVPTVLGPGYHANTP